MPAPKPLRKLNFMRKRLAHGIKRTGDSKKTGVKHIEKTEHRTQITDVKIPQLENVRLKKEKLQLIKNIEKIKNNSKGKGLVAHGKAMAEIKKLKTDFVLKFNNPKRIEDRQKRRANIIYKKFEKEYWK